MFPIINHLSDLQSHVQKDEIRFAPQSNGHTVVCYLFAGSDTFDSIWTEECRGISFAPDGFVSGRPLHKFYNLGEREGFQWADFDWLKIDRVYDKRDGSMITTVNTDDGIALKSKKSFSSDVAIAAKNWYDHHPDYQLFCEYLASNNCTAIFEWTSPDARIVLNYTEAELQLLHVRNNVSGEYFLFEDMKMVAADFVKVAEDSPSSIELNEMLARGENIQDRLMELVETLEGVEGWVFKFNDGKMVKVKTQWYLRLHRTMTFLRERDVAGLVVNEQLDDAKAQLVQEGIDITQVLEIEKQVSDELAGIYRVLREIGDALHGLSPKEAALKLGAEHGRHQYFGMLMAQHRGKEVDVKDWFIKNRLPEYSLRQLVMKNEADE